MDFPLIDTLSSEECYYHLIDLLHPGGLKCPAGHPLKNARIHRRLRAPILDYYCKDCGKIFNIFTNTPLKGTKYDPIQLIKCLDGMSRGISINRMAKEMGVCRKSLGKTCLNMKYLQPAVKKENVRIKWNDILKNIERWEIEDHEEGIDGTRLVVKVKNGRCYALTRVAFERPVPILFKKKKGKATKVEPLAYDYLSEKK